MKLLHVIGSMNPLTGGPCQGIRNLDRESQKLGIYREVVSLDEPTASFLGHDSFQIHALGPGKGPWQYSSKLIPWLFENLERFDTVIVNGLWLYPSYAVWKVIHQLKKNKLLCGLIPNFFVMPHGMMDPWFQNVKGRELKALRNWIYWKLFENKVVNDADGILFTCEAELLLARIPFRPYHLKQEINIGYGVEKPPPFSESMRKAFLEKCLEIDDQPYVLFLGRIHFKKGVDILIKAYSQILRENFKLMTKIPKLIIAGPGLETSFGQKLFSLVLQDPQLKNNILFVGMLSGEAKWGAFYGCEAFILPSHQENFGIAVAEALACSKPVLISNQVNIYREIESSNGGIIAENTLIGTQSLLLDWLELSPNEKKVLSENAKKTFEKHFDVKPAALRFKEAIST